MKVVNLFLFFLNLKILLMDCIRDVEMKIELIIKRKDVSDDYQRKMIRLEICDLKI